ncbi:MAG TPA: hypothetical protein VGJ05_22180 [Fimbriiglobus sp.]|jgi:hypothetical protein
MPTIHVPGDAHITPAPDTDGTRWDAYSDAKHKHTLERALFILKHNVRNSRPCDNCFKKLPGGRTFTEVFDDATVFISFDPDGPSSGATDSVGGKDITISVKELRVGRWTVAATLVHELAHVNGALGGNSPEAESMLNCCGFRALFRPGVVGAVEQSSDSRIA